MVVSVMRSTIGFGQLDTIAIYRVDGANVDPVGPDHFHMLFYLIEIAHGALLCTMDNARPGELLRSHLLDNGEIKSGAKHPAHRAIL